MKANSVRLLLLVLVCVSTATAQFQASSPDELKMTADPKYPNAAAIFLNYEMKTDNDVGYESVYARIKVLKESAKELATVTIEYPKTEAFDGIAAIQARTIHPDGVVIPLNMKPQDLTEQKSANLEIHRMVFNLPSVEVGSIIEYYYQVRLKQDWQWIPQWEVQNRYPVRKEHFLFRPLQKVDIQMQWYTHLPSGQLMKPDAAGRFELALTDMPPLPSEKWAPPIASIGYRVIFYFSDAVSQRQFWDTKGKQWLQEVHRFSDPNATIKQAVSGLIAPSDGDLDRAKKLYTAVQGLENTDYSRQRTEAERKREGLKSTKSAEDIWNQKSGDGEQIALLYLAMLKAAGLKAYPMFVVNRDRGVFNPDYLYFNQFDDVVDVLATADGKEIVLDPGEKMCPFQMVSWKHSGAGGIRENASGIGLWATPLLPFSANVVVRRGELTVSSDGSVNGKLQFGMAGEEALRWRQQALGEDEDSLKKNFDTWLTTQLPDGVQANVTHFAKLDDPTADLAAYATVAGIAGTATSKRLLLPASFFAFAEDQGFIQQPDRQLPVDMHYASVYKDGVLFHLPARFALETAPPATAVPWAGYAVYQMKSTANGNDLTVTRTLARAFTLLQPDEYGPMRDFYQKVQTADQQQIVLTNGQSAEKGN